MGERLNSVKLELDRFQNWLESEHEGWNKQARYCAGKGWQARAKLAAEQIERLEANLKWYKERTEELKEDKAELEARERENDALKDRLQDAHQLLVIVGNALGVEDEPHQTWGDRLMTAAKYADPKASEKTERERELVEALKSAKRDLRRAAMQGQDNGHYPAFHDVCEALAKIDAKESSDE